MISLTLAKFSFISEDNYDNSKSKHAKNVKDGR